MAHFFLKPLIAGAMLLALNVPLRAYDLTDRLSIEGLLVGTGQCQDLSDISAGPDTCRTALVFQPAVRYRPNANNELFAKFGFASGNGLNPVSPFTLAPWAATLEDDVQDINGRNRDHLLTAWYKHSFGIGAGRSVSFTGGIIDSTDYIDDNAYANNEYNQFMNEVFVNAATAFLPSFDYGAAIEFEIGNFSFKAVVMNIGENDDGNSYTFYGGQIARKINSGLGSGTYRLVITGTDEQFLDPGGADKKNLLGFTFNADQQLIGDRLGAFVRVAWQDDSAAIDYDLLLSGGLNIGGATWGRTGDNIGLAYAYLDDGNGEVSSTHTFEAYYRLAVHDSFALTGDVHYVKDTLKAGLDPEGFIFSLRGTAEF